MPLELSDEREVLKESHRFDLVYALVFRLLRLALFFV